jgi:hypothetical protein
VSRSWTTRRDVRLAARDAVKFLRDYEADGMKLENCPEYVREVARRRGKSRDSTSSSSASSIPAMSLHYVGRG